MKTVVHSLTDLNRATWIVEQAGVGPMLDANSRLSRRGRGRAGLDGRLFMILMIMAAMQGKVTIQRMWEIATGQLPRNLQWQLGIVRDNGLGGTNELSRKQLYDMAEKLSQHLSWTSPAALLLPQQERDRRQDLVQTISTTLLRATLVIPRIGTSLAVDESGVWAWTRGKAKPKDAPPLHPADEDLTLAQNARTAKANAQQAGLIFTPDGPIGPDTAVDEDAPTTVVPALNDPALADPVLAEPSDHRAAENPAALTSHDAFWGVKTSKDGGRNSYFGYAIHTLVRIPEVGVDRASTPEPLFVESFRVTPASTDVVDVTINMIKELIAAGQQPGDLLGDRHYSYKKWDRWALPLAELGVKLVHDIRKDDHGAVDYQGAKIITGTPHCPGTPEHFERLERPAVTASAADHNAFRVLIAERWAYAMQRRSPLDRTGKSRWACPALAGKVGCPWIQDSVPAARDNGYPVVTPPEAKTAFCTQQTVQVNPGKHMKYAQEHYWGGQDWEDSWNRRTYVEGVYGNLKNPNTENIHRGFFQITGLPLVTLALTAAVVSYNIRELGNWHERTGGADPEHPLIKTSSWTHGFEMLTSEQAAALDDQQRALRPAAPTPEPPALPQAA